MPRSPATRQLLILAVALTALLGGGCPLIQPPNNTSSGGSGLVRFQSADELLSYFRQQATSAQRSGIGGLLNYSFAPSVSAEAGDASTGNAGTSASETTESFSTTNLQETGVDESDIIKSDGANFYIAKGKSLRVVRAAPFQQMTELARLELDDYVDSLYLNGHRLLVLGNQYNYDYGGDRMVGMPAIWPPYYSGTGVSVTAIDIADPAAPAKAESVQLDGSIVSSRLVNGRLVLVLTVAPQMPANPTPLAINTMTIDQVLPQKRTADGAEPMIPVEDWYRPESPAGYYTTAVVTLDAANVVNVVGSVAVMAQAQTIYSSTSAAYIAASIYDQNSGSQTALHKFRYNSQGVAEYTASGAVPGNLLNQFSLDEFHDNLRVATHIDNFIYSASTGVASVGSGVSGSGSAGVDVPPSVSAPTAQSRQAGVSYNGIYVLAESDGALNIVGQVEDIAPGETLRSARFLDTHGFLVTYRQVDPLFVLDFANPAQPRIVGELSIPGFSEYLHPVDSTHLIGVGKSTTIVQGMELTNGVQLSLFDVSDWAHPTAVQQIVLGGRGSASDVEYTHKAFLYMPDTNLLALPVQLTTPTQWPVYGGFAFDGVIAFHVDTAAGFTEVGRLSSVLETQGSWAAWRRPAVIGNTLYAVTPDGLRAADMGDFTQPAALTLTPEPADPLMYAVDLGAAEPAPTR